MSMIQSLIKQAFGTSNANEAASFLASACNRMKSMSKPQITHEVETALKGVNFSRGGEQASAKPKTVYKDTKATLKKLADLENLIAELQRELNDAKKSSRTAFVDNPALTKKVRLLEGQVRELQKELNNAAERHLKESALLRGMMQREIDALKQSSTAPNADLKMRYEELLTSAQVIMDANEAHKNKIASLEQTLETVLAKGAELDQQRQAEIENLEAQVKLWKQIADVGDVAEKYSEEEINGLQKEIARLKAKIKEWEDYGDATDAHLAESKADYEAVVTERDELRRKCISLSYDLTDRDKTIRTLKSQTSTAIDDLQHERHLHRLATERCESLERQAEAQLKERGEMAEELEYLRTKLDFANRELAERKSEGLFDRIGRAITGG